MFDNVLVGVDGQQGGRDAIALARMLVADGGKLTFGYVYHGDPHVGGDRARRSKQAKRSTPASCS